MAAAAKQCELVLHPKQNRDREKKKFPVFCAPYRVASVGGGWSPHQPEVIIHFRVCVLRVIIIRKVHVVVHP